MHAESREQHIAAWSREKKGLIVLVPLVAAVIVPAPSVVHELVFLNLLLLIILILLLLLLFIRSRGRGSGGCRGGGSDRGGRGIGYSDSSSRGSCCVESDTPRFPHPRDIGGPHPHPHPCPYPHLCPFAPGKRCVWTGAECFRGTEGCALSGGRGRTTTAVTTAVGAVGRCEGPVAVEYTLSQEAEGEVRRQWIRVRPTREKCTQNINTQNTYHHPRTNPQRRVVDFLRGASDARLRR
ncbi:hypothetical protein B484DRAFT_446424 [Ochromonadaceae sp. CCMP2298]|nr:hypothetical protein B484DRAFT_446424 [Ochromonadaceae sp. CCMP2298]